MFGRSPAGGRAGQSEPSRAPARPIPFHHRSSSRRDVRMGSARGAAAARRAGPSGAGLRPSRRPVRVARACAPSISGATPPSRWGESFWPSRRMTLRPSRRTGRPSCRPARACAVPAQPRGSSDSADPVRADGRVEGSEEGGEFAYCMTRTDAGLGPGRQVFGFYSSQRGGLEAGKARRVASHALQAASWVLRRSARFFEILRDSARFSARFAARFCSARCCMRCHALCKALALLHAEAVQHAAGQGMCLSLADGRRLGMGVCPSDSDCPGSRRRRRRMDSEGSRPPPPPPVGPPQKAPFANVSPVSSRHAACNVPPCCPSRPHVLPVTSRAARYAWAGSFGWSRGGGLTAQPRRGSALAARRRRPASGPVAAARR